MVSGLLPPLDVGIANRVMLSSYPPIYATPQHTPNPVIQARSDKGSYHVDITSSGKSRYIWHHRNRPSAMGDVMHQSPTVDHCLAYSDPTSANSLSGVNVLVAG